MTKSEIVRVNKKLCVTRKRLVEEGFADELTEADELISKEVEKVFFREKRKRGFF